MSATTAAAKPSDADPANAFKTLDATMLPKLDAAPLHKIVAKNNPDAMIKHGRRPK